MVEKNFLAGRALLPQAVVYELQRIADAGDPARRRRGRRGLEMLGQLEALLGADLELVHDTFEGRRRGYQTRQALRRARCPAAHH
jgi:uncharacterized protein YacL